MKRIIRKWTAAALILALCAAGGYSALAEDTVGLVQHIPTTQAFIDEAVPRADLEEIVKAGLAAASAINQQPWYFAVITDPTVMANINGGGADFGASAPATPEGAAPAMPEGGAVPGMPEGGEVPAVPEGTGVPGAPAWNGSEGSGASSGQPQGMAAGGGAKASLGDSPAAVIIYKLGTTSSPNADFDCGLACQNMVIAANALGYGTKIVTSPTMTLNGARHDEICRILGVDTSCSAVAVLLIGKADTDAVSSATTREDMAGKVSFVQ